MSKKAGANAMDDVDRLFQCFKCGISPPPSAMRERKRRKNKLNQENVSSVAHKGSAASPSIRSTREGQGNVIDGHLDVANSNSRTVTLSGGKQISPVVFYGSPDGVPPKRPFSLLRLLHEIRIDLSEQIKSNIRKGVWATFPRQDEAMKFVKGHENVRVFSYQDHFSGQRRFLVSTYEEFWNRYKTMDPRHRHHYEVIQEGLPCHLYFDLEFNLKENTGKNGDEMVDILVSIILEALREKYSIEGHEDWVVELDSSTKDKFSRHLILRIPKTAFKDNSHVGAFVGEISSRIVNAKEKDGRLDKLFIRKEPNNSSTQLFVDTAVYSRNRCFRLALSSKAGKSSVLLPTGRFKCKNMGEEDVYMTSLICNIDLDCEKLLVCKMDLDCVKTLRFDTETTFIASFSNTLLDNNSLGRHQSFPQKSHLNSCFSDMSAPHFMGKSPFTDLDKFIESIASVGNVSGKIRCWYWFSEHGLIVYSMLRSRYCERIGREHKSNHVMYIVDLRRGVYYQKCYDPDCRDYRSPLRPVPESCIPEDVVYHQGPVNTHIQDQFDNQYKKGESYMDAEGNVDSASKDSWWLEAVKLADDLENKPKTLEFVSMETREEDDEWWLAAETSVSQAEQVCAARGPRPRYSSVWKTGKRLGTISKSTKLVSCVFADMEELGVKQNMGIISMVRKVFQKLELMDRYEKLMKRYTSTKREYRNIKGKRVRVQAKQLNELGEAEGSLSTKAGTFSDDDANEALRREIETSTTLLLIMQSRSWRNFCSMFRGQSCIYHSLFFEPA